MVTRLRYFVNCLEGMGKTTEVLSVAGVPAETCNKVYPILQTLMDAKNQLHVLANFA